MENQKYYYLKLKDDFFDNDELKILESMENGYLYSNILLKLYLKALKNDGKLVFNEYIPYDIKMLAVITGHNKDIVEKAIRIFKDMHLIDILDNGTIYMLDMQKMIGSISSEGIRKAQYREKINQEKLEKGTKLGQSPDIISISNSISNYNINNKKETKKDLLSGLDDDLKTAFNEFIKMRKLIKKPLTDFALTKIINKLNRFSSDKENQIKILEQSTIHCWQDIYELKNDNQQKTETKTATNSIDSYVFTDLDELKLS